MAGKTPVGRLTVPCRPYIGRLVIMTLLSKRRRLFKRGGMPSLALNETAEQYANKLGWPFLLPILGSLQSLNRWLWLLKTGD